MANGNTEPTKDVRKELPPSIVNIAVMGIIGAGKTTFVNTASGSELKVGHGVASCTQGIQAAPNFQLDGHIINLIDTPGFDDTDRSEVDLLKTIASYLEEQYSRNIKLHGVIYLHGIDGVRMGGMSRRAFALFRKICGTTNLGNVSIVTTRWSKVTTEEGRNREKELKTEYFKPALDDGAKMQRHSDTKESAQQLLRTFLSNTARALSLQEELVTEQKRVFKTKAGIHVRDDLNSLIRQAEREAKMGADVALGQKLGQYLRDRDEIYRSEVLNARGSRPKPEGTPQPNRPLASRRDRRRESKQTKSGGEEHGNADHTMLPSIDESHSEQPPTGLGGQPTSPSTDDPGLNTSKETAAPHREKRETPPSIKGEVLTREQLQSPSLSGLREATTKESVDGGKEQPAATLSNVRSGSIALLVNGGMPVAGGDQIERIKPLLNIRPGADVRDQSSRSEESNALPLRGPREGPEPILRVGESMQLSEALPHELLIAAQLPEQEAHPESFILSTVSHVGNALTDTSGSPVPVVRGPETRNGSPQSKGFNLLTPTRLEGAPPEAVSLVAGSTEHILPHKSLSTTEPRNFIGSEEVEITGTGGPRGPASNVPSRQDRRKFLENSKGAPNEARGEVPEPVGTSQHSPLKTPETEKSNPKKLAERKRGEHTELSLTKGLSVTEDEISVPSEGSKPPAESLPGLGAPTTSPSTIGLFLGLNTSLGEGIGRPPKIIGEAPMSKQRQGSSQSEVWGTTTKIRGVDTGKDQPTATLSNGRSGPTASPVICVPSNEAGVGAPAGDSNNEQLLSNGCIPQPGIVPSEGEKRWNGSVEDSHEQQELRPVAPGRTQDDEIKDLPRSSSRELPPILKPPKVSPTPPDKGKKENLTPPPLVTSTSARKLGESLTGPGREATPPQSQLPHRDPASPVLEPKDAKEDLRASTVNIAVMGITGAGKTTFVNITSGSQLEVGHGLASCTQGVQAAPSFQLDGRTINLIDTPGFDDTDRSEVQVLKTIATYLKERGEIKLQGVIYLYGIDATRMGGMSKRAFGLFRKICGTTNLGNVSIVTIKWGRVTTEEGRNREKELETKYFKSALEEGAKMRRHGDTKESAQQLLRTFLNNTPCALTLQTELVVEQKRVFSTEAGKHVEEDLNNLIKQAEREAKARTDTAPSQRLEEYLRDVEVIRRSEAPNAPPQGPRESPKLVPYAREGMQSHKEVPPHDIPSTTPLSEQEARPGASVPSTVGKALTDTSGSPRSKKPSARPGGESTLPPGSQAPEEAKTQTTSIKTATVEGAKKEFPASTINIAVMGVSGAGKTSFVNIASGSDLKVGHGLDSCTQGVQVAPSFRLGGHIINLIDTPGFDDTDRSEVELLKIFANFFGEHRNVQLQGVIYLHNIGTDRMGSTSRRAFALFKEICGITNLRNVTIVTTRWDKVTTEQGEIREKELETRYFKPALDDGAKMQRHDDTKESAQQLLRTFLNNTPRALNLQTELATEKKHVFNTRAGIHVKNDLEDLIRRARETEFGTDAALSQRLDQYARDMDVIRQYEEPNTSPHSLGRGAESVPPAREGTPTPEAPPHDPPAAAPSPGQEPRTTVSEPLKCSCSWWKKLFCRNCPACLRG